MKVAPCIIETIYCIIELRISKYLSLCISGGFSKIWSHMARPLPIIIAPYSCGFKCTYLAMHALG